MLILAQTGGVLGVLLGLLALTLFDALRRLSMF